jgi:tRNA pseudouridine13 synthase
MNDTLAEALKNDPRLASLLESAPVDEPAVGITEYTSPDTAPFTAILKHRYSDFIVHEIDLSGRTVALTDDSVPGAERDHPFPGEPNLNEDDQKWVNESIEQFKTLVGDVEAVENAIEWMKARRKWLGWAREFKSRSKTAEGSGEADSEIPPEPPIVPKEFLLPADGEKEHRAAVHGLMSERFNFILSDTQQVKPESCFFIIFGLFLWFLDSESKTPAADAPMDVSEDADAPTEPAKPSKEASKTNESTSHVRLRLRTEVRNTRGQNQHGWNDSWGTFLHFTLYKENLTTVDMIQSFSRMLRSNDKIFGIAGTKDKRGCTSQRVSVKRVSASRMQALVRNNLHAAVGNFEFAKDALSLGDLKGNRFTIALRDVSMAGDGAFSFFFFEICSTVFLSLLLLSLLFFFRYR